MDSDIVPFIFDHAPIGMILMNDHGDITYANRAVMDLFGYNPQALIHKHIAALVPPPFDYRPVINNPPGQKKHDILGLRIDGSSFPAILSIAPLPETSSNSKARFVLYIQENINQTKRDEFTAKYIKIDPLTGFLNHHAFEHRLKREHEREQRHKRAYGIFIMNIYPRTNDRPDHDDLMRIFADYCRYFFRKSDVLGCWNNDEFIVFLPEIDAQSAQSIAARLIHSIPLPHVDNDKSPEFGINIGISLSQTNLETDSAQTYQSIITQAAENLKQANAKGLNHYIY